jgi:hypothetical protein
MKKLLLLAAAALPFLSALAQSPASFELNTVAPPHVREVPGFSSDYLNDLAYFYMSEEGRDLTGLVREDAFDFFTYATYTETHNGTGIWRLQFHSDNAQALMVYFNDFHLPEGASMYIYNEDGSYFEGPIDHSENNAHKQFVTNDIFGEDIVLEYVQPAGVVGSPSLMVRGIGYIFRYAERQEANNRGNSDPCQVDVACPEAEPWDCQIDSVVRLRITDSGQIFVCSGVMVNTTARDCRQYLLSALHCTEGVSTSDLGLLQVRFDYNRQNCGTGGGLGSRNRTGVLFLADSNDGVGNSGSDFVLYEVEDEIPLDWDPYYAGWDATGVGSVWGAGIHHPAGDVKKISFYTTALTSQWWGAPGSHWGVRWSETESGWGVTEGGSSGSPIYNSNGLIVGTLTGGLSACEAGGAGPGTGPTQLDYYGKMSHHWELNPNVAAEKLRVWLDPLGSGPNATETPTKVMHGAYRSEGALPCGVAGQCDAVSIDEELELSQRFTVSPNPTSGDVFIRTDASVSLSLIRLYDSQGRMIEEMLNPTAVSRFDVSRYEGGVYYVYIETVDGKGQTQRVVKLK